jgi:hypothetical protein
MTQHRCEQCGADNAPDAQFCAKCDFYLGWDSGGGSLGGSPLTSSGPVVRQTHSQKFPAVSLSPDRPRRSHPPPINRNASATRPATAPRVSLVTEEEVVLDPNEGGTFDVRIHNTSSIVDGYTVDAPHAPPWLKIDHPEIRLLTDEEKVTTVSLGIRPEYDVYVQRLRLRVQICSVENPAKRTDAELIVVVPRVGGPVAISAEPNLLRLRDEITGRFRIRLDNKESNYPQRYALTGSDPERVVRFSFRPAIVEVPPMRATIIEARFDAPPLQLGQQLHRTLTVVAASDEVSVETIINVAQERSQAPPDSPVRLRLEPSITRTRDQTAAAVSVLVDNRRGSKDRRLFFSGRDPEGRLRFAFSQPQLYLRAGEQARLNARIEAPLPRPGEEVERGFTVVCNDGTDESEATGSLVQAASASPITTARIRLEPERVVVRNRRRGSFRVAVDNVRGSLPLAVRLSGSDPEGAVRFTFIPTHLVVPPLTIGRSALRVEASLPGSGQEVNREIQVSASDGVGAVETDGHYSQSMSEILPILRLVFTLLGGLLVVLGAMRPWFADLPTYYISLLPKLEDMIKIPDETARSVAISQPSGRALMLVLAAVMMLGILSRRGKITILAGFAIAVLMIGYIYYAQTEFSSGGPAYGSLLVVLGGIIGAVGGFCIKRTGSS